MTLFSPSCAFLSFMFILFKISSRFIFLIIYLEFGKEASVSIENLKSDQVLDAVKKLATAT